MYNTDDELRKRVIRLSVVTFVVIIIISFLWYGFTHSWLNLNTSDGAATITITSNSGEVIKNNVASFSGFLPKGEYRVEAISTTAAQNEPLKLAAFGITTKQLKMNAVSAIEPVTNRAAQDASVSSNGLYFIDQDTAKLYYTLPQNTTSLIGAPRQFNSLQFYDTNHAIATAYDNNGTRTLYRITSSSIDQIAIPNDIVSTKYLSFSISGSTLYISGDGKLYSTDLTTVSWKQLSRIPVSATIGAVHNNLVLVQKLNTVSEGKYDITLLDTTSGEITNASVDYIESPDSIFQARFSPDGTKLMFSSTGVVSIYDTSLNKLQTLPGSTYTSAAWRTDSKLVATSKNIVWEYDLPTTVLSALAFMPQYTTLGSVVLPGDSPAVYFTSQAGNEVSLYRSAPAPLTVDQNALRLGESNIQTVGDNCSIFYMNFTRLAIVASTNGDKQACIAAINDYLNRLSVPETIPIQFI